VLGGRASTGKLAPRVGGESCFSVVDAERNGGGTPVGSRTAGDGLQEPWNGWAAPVEKARVAWLAQWRRTLNETSAIDERI
jgi:hypothetical protein